MKTNIDSEEWYPVRTVITGKDIYMDASEVIEIPDAKVRQIQKVFREFQKVQDYLRELDAEHTG